MEASLNGSFTAGVATETFTTPAKEPDPPTEVRITGDSTTSLTVRWQAPDSDRGASITGYRVQWMTNGQSFSSGRLNIVGLGSLSHTITGLEEGAFYFVRVVAVNAAGNSDGSNLAYGRPGRGPDSYGYFN